MEDNIISDISRRSSIDAARVARFLAVFAGIVREECGNENNVARNMLLPPSIELRFKPGGMLRKNVKEVQK